MTVSHPVFGFAVLKLKHLIQINHINKAQIGWTLTGRFSHALFHATNLGSELQELGTSCTLN